MKNRKPGPNPYMLAFLTAILSGLFSVLSIHVTSIYHDKHEKLSKNIELKKTAYMLFLDRVNNGKSTVVNNIQYIGKLADKSYSDGELQEVENYLSTLPKQIDVKLLIELNQDFSILEACGSKDVRKTINDFF
jgi:GTP-binding protein EngB required for normal cell division